MRLFPRLRRWAIVAFLTYGAWQGAQALVVVVNALAPQDSYRKDFLQDWLWGRAWSAGVNPYQPLNTLAAHFIGPNVYTDAPWPTPHPPPLELFLLPFARLDYPLALALWLLVELVCLAASLVLIYRALGWRLGWRTNLLFFALLGFWPVTYELWAGQVMLLMMVALSGAFLALSRQRMTVAGVLIGCALLIKPLFWPLVLLFLLRREVRAVVASILTVGAGYVAAALAFGPSLVATYLLNVLPDADSFPGHTWNVTVYSLAYRLVGGAHDFGASLPPVAAFPALAHPLAIAVLLLTILATLWLTRRQSLVTAFAVLMLASIIAGPLAWDYYLPLALPSVVYLAARLDADHAPMWTWLVAILAAHAITLGAGAVQATDYATNPLGDWLLTGLPVAGIIAIALLLLRNTQEASQRGEGGIFAHLRPHERPIPLLAGETLGKTRLDSLAGLNSRR